MQFKKSFSNEEESSKKTNYDFEIALTTNEESNLYNVVAQLTCN